MPDDKKKYSFTFTERNFEEEELTLDNILPQSNIPTPLFEDNGGNGTINRPPRIAEYVDDELETLNDAFKRQQLMLRNVIVDSNLETVSEYIFENEIYPDIIGLEKGGPKKYSYEQEGYIYNKIKDVPNESWLAFWHYWIWILAGFAVIVTAWLAYGGLKNLKEMFEALDSHQADTHDDG